MSDVENKPEQETGSAVPPPPPAPLFFRIVETFAVPAMVWTGYLRNPADEKAEPNLELAKYQIGILELLEQKTKGNLTDEEKVYLDEMLHAVRMAFLRASEHVKKGETQSPKGEGQSSKDEEKG